MSGETKLANTLYPTGSDLEKAGSYVDESMGANLLVVLTNTVDPPGCSSCTVGIAWTGVACYTGSARSYRVSVNGKFPQSTTILNHAETAVHEIGHNLGMGHDFNNDESTRYYKGNACNSKGVMSYGEKESEWSQCSWNDFKAYYNYERTFNSWCLDGK